MQFLKPTILLIVFIIHAFQASSQDEKVCLERIRRYSINIRYPKYTGPVTVSNDTIKLDNSIIIIKGTDTSAMKIFESGLVFPELIYSASTMGDKFEFKSFKRTDTLLISNVSELWIPGQSANTKYFRFLLWRRKMANPSLYLLEITNNAAKQQSPIELFIDKANVTAFGFCSILI